MIKIPFIYKLTKLITLHRNKIIHLPTKKHPNKVRHRKKWKALRRLRWFVIVLLPTLVTYYLFLSPRISIYPGESLNPHDPFLTPFIFKNDGELPIYNINFSVIIEKLEAARKIKIINTSIQPTGATIRKLDKNKTSVMFLEHTVSFSLNSIAYATIKIHVTYKPFLFLWAITEDIRFNTRRKNTGEYVWLEDYSKN